MLLRLIENKDFSDIRLTNSISPENLKSKKILLIGIMNEDPELLTKTEKIMRIVSDEKLFGGIIGDILYDYFKHHLRRLREDLYFRFQRYGIIKIPELNERREDIPILFYNFLKRNGINNPIIEYEVFELLMDKSIQWPGNIRQLQAVAKEVSNRVTEGVELIDYFMVQEVLSNIGMIK